MAQDVVTYKPPVEQITVPVTFGSGIGILTTLISINKMAGAAIGNAIIQFPGQYARDASVTMGDRAKIKIGNQWVFRGAVGYAPYYVSNDQDLVELQLWDDKWIMGRNIVGQYGIGTLEEDAGFDDVGYEVVFNANGRPNKHLTLRKFSKASTAVYWTLRDIMLWLFDYYIDADVAKCASSELKDGYTRSPSNLNLVGLTALQAVDQVAQLAGQSWGLTAHISYSEFVAVKPGAGKIFQVKQFQPWGESKVSRADEQYPVSVDIKPSIQHCRDAYQAISGPQLVECVYTTLGDDPLLTRLTTFVDKKYAARYKVDVTKYAEHGLGSALAAGAKPKPWQADLVTRVKADGSAYLTAAEVVANDTLRDAQRAERAVWISTDGTEDNAVLVTGGVRFDDENGTLDFESTVDIKTDAGVDTDLLVSDWSTVAVWLTVVTVLELPIVVETDADLKYLPDTFTEVIRKPDLVPEIRSNSWLPDLSAPADANAIAKVAEPDPGGDLNPETYIDVEDRLQDAIDSAIEASSTVENSVSLAFEFIPVIELGNCLSFVGRDNPSLGTEVVTSLNYGWYEDFVLRVEASNLPATIDPEKYIEA